MIIMANRSESRKLAMTVLYQIEIMKENKIPYEVDNIISDNVETENVFVNDLVYGVITNEEKLIAKADTLLKDWNMKRLDKVGSTILKMSLYELEYMDTPSIVVINEAVELAKNYTDEELAKMINAVLDKTIKK